MSSTHYAAVQNGIVISTRSSASRHVDGQGKFGPYTYAVVRTERVTTPTTPATVKESTDVITWHGGLANAHAGLKAAKVGFTWTENRYDDSPAPVHHYLAAHLVEVVITPKKPKVGQVLTTATVTR